MRFLNGSLNPILFFRWLGYKVTFAKNHPDWFHPEGTLIFCGPQGSGKTLSMVQYVRTILKAYPKAILCTNTDIDLGGLSNEVIEYKGLDSLKAIENGEKGVLYVIDEIHLELNSLESKNIDIDVMVEISQQRKQRKHIVGTSQVYMRMAKPLREQVRLIVQCRNILGCIQFNRLIDGFESVEENGKLEAKVLSRHIWFHDPRLYKAYDTYAKMKRYRDEWQGRPRINLEGGYR